MAKRKKTVVRAKVKTKARGAARKGASVARKPGDFYPPIKPFDTGVLRVSPVHEAPSMGVKMCSCFHDLKGPSACLSTKPRPGRTSLCTAFHVRQPMGVSSSSVATAPSTRASISLALRDFSNGGLNRASAPRRAW